MHVFFKKKVNFRIRLSVFRYLRAKDICKMMSQLHCPCTNYLDCGQISPPAHGHISYMNNTTTYMSTAAYMCDIGHQLFGSATVECDESGNWNDTANCTIKG